MCSASEGPSTVSTNSLTSSISLVLRFQYTVSATPHHHPEALHSIVLRSVSLSEQDRLLEGSPDPAPCMPPRVHSVGPLCDDRDGQDDMMGVDLPNGDPSEA